MVFPFLTYYFLLFNTDKTTPVNVITAPIASCIKPASNKPLVTKTPPTNVNACLTKPKISSLFTVFYYFLVRIQKLFVIIYIFCTKIMLWKEHKKPIKKETPLKK